MPNIVSFYRLLDLLPLNLTFLDDIILPTVIIRKKIWPHDDRNIVEKVWQNDRQMDGLDRSQSHLISAKMPYILTEIFSRLSNLRWFITDITWTNVDKVASR